MWSSVGYGGHEDSREQFIERLLSELTGGMDEAVGLAATQQQEFAQLEALLEQQRQLFAQRESMMRTMILQLQHRTQRAQQGSPRATPHDSSTHSSRQAAWTSTVPIHIANSAQPSGQHAFPLESTPRLGTPSQTQQYARSPGEPRPQQQLSSSHQQVLDSLHSIQLQAASTTVPTSPVTSPTNSTPAARTWHGPRSDQLLPATDVQRIPQGAGHVGGCADDQLTWQQSRWEGPASRAPAGRGEAGQPGRTTAAGLGAWTGSPLTEQTAQGRAGVHGHGGPGSGHLPYGADAQVELVGQGPGGAVAQLASIQLHSHDDGFQRQGERHVQGYVALSIGPAPSESLSVPAPHDAVPQPQQPGGSFPEAGCPQALAHVASYRSHVAIQMPAIQAGHSQAATFQHHSHESGVPPCIGPWQQANVTSNARSDPDWQQHVYTIRAEQLPGHRACSPAQGQYVANHHVAGTLPENQACGQALAQFEAPMAGGHAEYAGHEACESGPRAPTAHPLDTCGQRGQWAPSMDLGDPSGGHTHVVLGASLASLSRSEQLRSADAYHEAGSGSVAGAASGFFAGPEPRAPQQSQAHVGGPRTAAMGGDGGAMLTRATGAGVSYLVASDAGAVRGVNAPPVANACGAQLEGLHVALEPVGDAHVSVEDGAAQWGGYSAARQQLVDGTDRPPALSHVLESTPLGPAPYETIEQQADAAAAAIASSFGHDDLAERHVASPPSSMEPTSPDGDAMGSRSPHPPGAVPRLSEAAAGELLSPSRPGLRSPPGLPRAPDSALRLGSREAAAGSLPGSREAAGGSMLRSYDAAADSLLGSRESAGGAVLSGGGYGGDAKRDGGGDVSSRLGLQFSGNLVDAVATLTAELSASGLLGHADVAHVAASQPAAAESAELGVPAVAPDSWASGDQHPSVDQVHELISHPAQAPRHPPSHLASQMRDGPATEADHVRVAGQESGQLSEPQGGLGGSLVTTHVASPGSGHVQPLGPDPLPSPAFSSDAFSGDATSRGAWDPAHVRNDGGLPSLEVGAGFDTPQGTMRAGITTARGAYFPRTTTSVAEGVFPVAPDASTCLSLEVGPLDMDRVGGATESSRHSCGTLGGVLAQREEVAVEGVKPQGMTSAGVVVEGVKPRDDPGDDVRIGTFFASGGDDVGLVEEGRAPAKREEEAVEGVNPTGVALGDPCGEADASRGTFFLQGGDTCLGEGGAAPGGGEPLGSGALESSLQQNNEVVSGTFRGLSVDTWHSKQGWQHVVEGVGPVGLGGGATRGHLLHVSITNPPSDDVSNRTVGLQNTSPVQTHAVDGCCGVPRISPEPYASSVALERAKAVEPAATSLQPKTALPTDDAPGTSHAAVAEPLEEHSAVSHTATVAPGGGVASSATPCLAEAQQCRSVPLNIGAPREETYPRGTASIGALAGAAAANVVAGTIQHSLQSAAPHKPSCVCADVDATWRLQCSEGVRLGCDANDARELDQAGGDHVALASSPSHTLNARIGGASDANHQIQELGAASSLAGAANVTQGVGQNQLADDAAVASSEGPFLRGHPPVMRRAPSASNLSPLVAKVPLPEAEECAQPAAERSPIERNPAEAHPAAADSTTRSRNVTQRSKRDSPNVTPKHSSLSPERENTVKGKHTTAATSAGDDTVDCELPSRGAGKRLAKRSAPKGHKKLLSPDGGLYARVAQRLGLEPPGAVGEHVGVDLSRMPQAQLARFAKEGEARCAALRREIEAEAERKVVMEDAYGELRQLTDAMVKQQIMEGGANNKSIESLLRLRNEINQQCDLATRLVVERPDLEMCAKYMTTKHLQMLRTMSRDEKEFGARVGTFVKQCETLRGTGHPSKGHKESGGSTSRLVGKKAHHTNGLGGRRVRGGFTTYMGRYPSHVGGGRTKVATLLGTQDSTTPLPLSRTPYLRNSPSPKLEALKEASTRAAPPLVARPTSQPAQSPFSSRGVSASRMQAAVGGTAMVGRHMQMAPAEMAARPGKPPTRTGRMHQDQAGLNVDPEQWQVAAGTAGLTGEGNQVDNPQRKDIAAVHASIQQVDVGSAHGADPGVAIVQDSILDAAHGSRATRRLDVEGPSPTASDAVAAAHAANSYVNDLFQESSNRSVCGGAAQELQWGNQQQVTWQFNNPLAGGAGLEASTHGSVDGQQRLLSDVAHQQWQPIIPLVQAAGLHDQATMALGGHAYVDSKAPASQGPQSGVARMQQEQEVMLQGNQGQEQWQFSNPLAHLGSPESEAVRPKSGALTVSEHTGDSTQQLWSPSLRDAEGDSRAFPEQLVGCSTIEARTAGQGKAGGEEGVSNDLGAGPAGTFTLQDHSSAASPAVAEPPVPERELVTALVATTATTESYHDDDDCAQLLAASDARSEPPGWQQSRDLGPFTATSVFPVGLADLGNVRSPLDTGNSLREEPPSEAVQQLAALLLHTCPSLAKLAKVSTTMPALLRAPAIPAEAAPSAVDGAGSSLLVESNPGQGVRPHSTDAVPTLPSPTLLCRRAKAPAYVDVSENPDKATPPPTASLPETTQLDCRSVDRAGPQCTQVTPSTQRRRTVTLADEAGTLQMARQPSVEGHGGRLSVRKLDTYGAEDKEDDAVSVVSQSLGSKATPRSTLLQPTASSLARSSATRRPVRKAEADKLRQSRSAVGGSLAASLALSNSDKTPSNERETSERGIATQRASGTLARTGSVKQAERRVGESGTDRAHPSTPRRNLVHMMQGASSTQAESRGAEIKVARLSSTTPSRIPTQPKPSESKFHLVQLKHPSSATSIPKTPKSDTIFAHSGEDGAGTAKRRGSGANLHRQVAHSTATGQARVTAKRRLDLTEDGEAGPARTKTLTQPTASSLARSVAVQRQESTSPGWNSSTQVSKQPSPASTPKAGSGSQSPSLKVDGHTTGIMHPQRGLKGVDVPSATYGSVFTSVSKSGVLPLAAVTTSGQLGGASIRGKVAAEQAKGKVLLSAQAQLSVGSDVKFSAAREGVDVDPGVIEEEIWGMVKTISTPGCKKAGLPPDQASLDRALGESVGQ